MSEQSQGEGWWQASDGSWYPPNFAPGVAPSNQSLPSPPTTVQAEGMLKTLLSPQGFLNGNYVRSNGFVGGFSSSDVVIGLLLLVIGVAAPLALAAAFKTFSVPQNDDWAFRLVATHFFNTGHFRYNNWEAMILYGQVFWTWLFKAAFGFHQWIFAVSVAALASFGILSAYAVVRRLATRGWALFLVFLMSTFIGISYNTGNYMTDLPAFSLALVSIYFGAKCSESSEKLHWVNLSLSMFTGIWAFSIRQFAIAAPLAVLLALYCVDRSKKNQLIGIGFLLLVICTSLLEIANHTPGFVHSHFQLPTYAALIQELRMFETLSFMMSPAIFIAAWRIWPHRWNNAVSLGTLAGAAISIYLLVFESSNFFAGDYFWQGGITSWLTLTGTWPNLFPNYLWNLFIAVGIVSSACLVGIAMHTLSQCGLTKFEKVSSTKLLLSLYCAFSAALVFLSGMVGEPQFERFLWPIAFTGSVLLVIRNRVEIHGIARSFKNARISAGILTAVLTLVSLTLSVSTLSLDSAVWKVGESLVRQGYNSDQIDAGFTWLGTEAGTIHKPNGDSRGGFMLYNTQFKGPRFVVIVSVSKLSIKTLQLIDQVHYKQFGLFRTKSLYVYKIERSL
jgi:hypothetical protein